MAGRAVTFEGLGVLSPVVKGRRLAVVPEVVRRVVAVLDVSRSAAGDLLRAVLLEVRGVCGAISADLENPPYLWLWTKVPRWYVGLRLRL